MAQSNRSLIDAVTRHQVLLERLKTGAYSDLNSVLDEYGDEIRAAILSLNIDELVRMSRPQLQQLVSDLQLIERQILSPEVRRFQREVLPAIAASEAAFEVSLLSNAVAASKTFDAVILSPVDGAAMIYAENLPVNATGQLLEKVIGNWERGEVERLENMVQRAFVEGRTTRQLAKDIWAPELFETKRRAEAVARTAIQHVSQSAREQVWIDNDQIVEKYEFVATLDSRTSAKCRSNDGKEFEVGKGPRPPLHFQCRSTTVPVLGPEFDFLDEGATRASVKGPVDADLTYYEWLKTQPAAFQDAAIGKARGKLLRDGGLSAERFADLNLGRNFEPLTLDEMKKLEPLAFKKAGL